MSFNKFLGLESGDKVPDEKTIRAFSEELPRKGIVEDLSIRFRIYLGDKGLIFNEGENNRSQFYRSRYLLFTSPDYWTLSQMKREKILFRLYPDIKQAFSLVHSLRSIYNKKTS